jgi:hypothetical protein
VSVCVIHGGCAGVVLYAEVVLGCFIGYVVVLWGCVVCGCIVRAGVM